MLKAETRFVKCSLLFTPTIHVFICGCDLIKSIANSNADVPRSFAVSLSLAIFNFNAFFDPGSIAKLKLNMTIDGKGVWVPIKSLSQSEQGIWAIYTINQDKIVVRDLVDIIYFEGEYAYVNGTLKNGDLVILGGAQKIIEGKLIN